MKIKLDHKLPFFLSTLLLTLCFGILNQKAIAQAKAAPTTKLSEEEVHKITTTSVEQLPTFPGGNEKLKAFIVKNLDQSKPSKPARVNVTFVVEKDGALSDIKAIGRFFDRIAADEAVRVISLSPKWIPGKDNGKPIKVQYTLPIVFN